jgi:hypothetical protein
MGRLYQRPCRSKPAWESGHRTGNNAPALQMVRAVHFELRVGTEKRYTEPSNMAPTDSPLWMR